MTNLTELLGDIECYLAAERIDALKLYNMRHSIEDADKLGVTIDLIDRVRAALVELDERRQTA